jgi:hypothetical protein
MPDPSSETIKLMRLAVAVRRPLRRFEESARAANRSFTGSDDYEAAVRRGTEALDEFGRAVRAWVAEVDTDRVRGALGAVTDDLSGIAGADPLTGWTKIFADAYRRGPGS